MRDAFVRRVLSSLIGERAIGADESVLAVCAGAAEERLFRDLGFGRVTLSGVEKPAAPGGPFEFSAQDAQTIVRELGGRGFAFYITENLNHDEAEQLVRGLTEPSTHQ